jgi:hypothetical protein
MPQSLFSSERPASGDGLVNRQAQAGELYRAATSAAPRTVFVMGEAHSGKSTLLLSTFERIFAENGESLPIWFCALPDRLSPETFSRDFLYSLIQQFLAFRRNDAQLLSAPLLTEGNLLSLCFPEERGIVQSLLQGYDELLKTENETERQHKLLQYALGAPEFLAQKASLRVALLLDEAHLLNEIRADNQPVPLLSEMLESSRYTLIITGLQRALPEKLTINPERLGDVWYVWTPPLEINTQLGLLERWCQSAQVPFNHETLRLAVEQMQGNLFYLRPIISAAGELGKPLTDAVEFQHLYINEMLRGRIAQHFSALVRKIARRASAQPRGESRSPEIVDVCYDALETIVSRDFFERRLHGHFVTERLLRELHCHELITLTGDQIRISDDSVFRDWLFATHQRFTGIPAEEVHLELLGRRMRKLSRVVSRSELRAFNARLVALLSKFDQQVVPRSLLSHDEFLIRYTRLKYDQILAGLSTEPDRRRLPQIIYVTEASLPEGDACSTWSVLLGYGFDEAKYDKSHETIWLVAATSNAEAVTGQDIAQLRECLESVRLPLSSQPRIVRWMLSRSGFTPEAIDESLRDGFLHSDYLQLELLGELLETLERVKSAESEKPLPAIRPERGDLDIAIPMGQEREIISANIIEKTARAAGLSNERINQLKTAIIEACLSLGAMNISYDGRLHQRVHLTGDKIIVMLATSSLALDETQGSPLNESQMQFWRMDILRNLADEVKLHRVPGGVRTEIVRYCNPAK